MIVVAGSLNMDLVGRVPRLPLAGETVLGTGFARHQGGKGGNQAVAAARAGASVALAGAVGDDAFGDALVQGLHDEGIDAAGVRRVGVASGCALITVADDGQNTIAVLPGANLEAPPPPTRWPEAWRWLVVQLEWPLDTVCAWALAARRAGAKVLLNAAPAATLPATLTSALDMLVVNQHELAALAGPAQGAASAVPAGQLRAVAVALGGPRCIVATLGAGGAVALDGDALIEVAGHAVDVVDTTGAGDAFVGVLAAGLRAGRPLASALVRANVAAALSCTRMGARAGLPTAAQLDDWLAAHGAAEPALARVVA